MTGSPGNEAEGAAARTARGGRWRARVVARRTMGSTVWLTVAVPRWPGALPGQFALLQAEPSGCFLARPLSIAGEDRQHISFLVAPVGTGTRELAALGPGEAIWVLGPLGNGFPLDELVAAGGRLVVVGGGVGVAPFPLLLAAVARSLRAETLPTEVLVLLGFRDRAQAQAAAPVVETACAVDRAGLACRTVIVTEDGSVGARQKVTEALAAEVRPRDRLAVCGPQVMARAVWDLCAAVNDVKSWYSLEAGMACGVGSCHGCVVPLADGSLARVCAEGPVFAGAAVFGSAVFGMGATDQAAALVRTPGTGERASS